MDNELISIIVPCYNVEQYLDRCVKSLVDQTYKNIEIILVDDGSTDATGEKCDVWAEKNKVIKTYHKENGGLSDARNYGMLKSSGKYFFFVDSDDYVSTNIVEFLYNSLKNSDSDISTCQHVTFYENELPKDENKNINVVYNTEDALSELMYQNNVTTSAWGKLYKRELFNYIKYPKGKVCEDLPVTYLLFAKSKRISINSKRLYYYFIRNGSIMHSKFNKNRLDALDFSKEETEYIQKKFPKLINAAFNREFMEAVYVSKRIPYTKEFKEHRKVIKSILKKYRLIVLKDKKAKRNSKIYALASYFGILGIKIIFKINGIVGK